MMVRWKYSSLALTTGSLIDHAKANVWLMKYMVHLNVVWMKYDWDESIDGHLGLQMIEHMELKMVYYLGL